MATLGVVSYASATPHNKIPILQQSSSNNSLNSNNNERREIIILRKKPKLAVMDVKPSIAATASTPTSVLVNNNSGGVRPHKRPPSGAMLPRNHHQPPPVAVARRNARERNRVKQVNNGFATLRQHIPVSIAAAYASSAEASSGRSGSKKLSKVETLRMAVDYIRSLQELLEMDNADATNTSNSSVESASSFPSTSPTPSNSSPNQQHLQQTNYQYEEDSGRDNSPTILIDEDEEDDDDTSLLDPTSPQQVASNLSQYHRLGNGQLIQLVSGTPEFHKNFVAGTQHLYEVDENMAPIIVSPQNLTRSLPSDIIAGVHSLAGLEMYPQVSSANLSLLAESSASRLGHPTSSLSPGVYSDQSLSPATGQDAASAAEDAASGASPFLPAFTTALKPTVLHHLAPSLSTLVHHGYQGLQLPVKKEDIAPQVVGAGGDMIDMMTWWEQDQRLRQQTTSS